MNREFIEKYQNWIGFGIVFLIAFGVYLYTISPTVPFWDCGEFISCAYELGVPHPPGTPLMVLIGKMFTYIPFNSEIAWRVNLFSAVTSAGAVAFLYLVFMSILQINGIIEEKLNRDTIIAHIIAISGSMLAAFSFSFWDSAVEAEAYGPSAFIITFLLYMAIYWSQHQDMKQNRRILLFIAYLAVLSMGIHLMPLLVVPGILIFAYMVRRDVFLDWHFWAWVVGLSVFAVTVYFYLMIRAYHDPYVNESDPRTFQQLWDVFTRKQYGTMSMIPRKTQWETGYNLFVALWEQIKMYLRYFSWQYMPYPKNLDVSPFMRVISLLFTWFVGVTSVYGMFYHYEKDKKTFALVWTTFFLLSFGLIWYLNLKFSPSDPNPFHNPREVRERDYFYAPSYIFIAFYAAMGLWSLYEYIKKSFGSWSKSLYNTVVYSLVILTIFVGFVPLAANISSDANRRGDWAVDEYAKNMLDTPMDNSILFTNGDNDTFPLWFAQVVKKYRRYNKKKKTGVLVANLSLLNTNWYLKQLKRAGAPLSMPDELIDKLRPMITRSGDTLWVKDFAIRDMLATNAGIPLTQDILFGSWENFEEKVMKYYKEDSCHIYFGVTVSKDNKGPYEQHLILEGLAYRVVKDKGFHMIDPERVEHNIYHVYRYDAALNAPHKEKDEMRRLYANYAAGFYELGMYYRRTGNIKKAIKVMQDGLRFMSLAGDPGPFMFMLSDMYLKMGEVDSALAMLEGSLKNEKSKDRKALMKYLMGRIMIEKGRLEGARKVFNDMIKEMPDDPSGYAGMISIYSKENKEDSINLMLTQLFVKKPAVFRDMYVFFASQDDVDNAIKVLDFYVKKIPQDKEAKKILSYLKRFHKIPDPEDIKNYKG